SRTTTSPAHRQATSLGQRESASMLTKFTSRSAASKTADCPGASWMGAFRVAAEPSRPQAASATAINMETRYRPIMPPILLPRDPYVVDACFHQARRAGISRFDQQTDRLAGERRQVRGGRGPRAIE